MTIGALLHMAHTLTLNLPNIRVDPSRFGPDRLCPPDWALASDDWVIRCRNCEHDDRRENIAIYERTFCPHHHTPLILKRHGWREEDPDEDSEDTSSPLTVLESAIAEALCGGVPVSAAGTLTANDFLIIVQDLLSFAVETWEIKGPRSARTIDQQAGQMNRHAAILFRHEWARGYRVRCDGIAPIQLRHLADPAARRAALRLVLQVIWYIPSGERLALRSGDTPQDSFFGYPCHAGGAWLTERARAWPIGYRRRHWHGFVEDADNLKVKVRPLKGYVDSTKGYSQHRRHFGVSWTAWSKSYKRRLSPPSSREPSGSMRRCSAHGAMCQRRGAYPSHRVPVPNGGASVVV